MLRIGLTGGIGSGKSTVAKIFEVLGIPVFYADEEAKRLMNEDEKLRQQIIYHFGEKTYTDNILDRSYLASLVFANEEKTKLINSIIHPATVAHAAKWMELQKAPYAVKEAALIFEAGAEKELDRVIGVSAPAALRISRTMQRDHIPEEAVRARMNKQMNEDEKMRRCDSVIINDDVQMLTPQVLKLHEELLKISVGE